MARPIHTNPRIIRAALAIADEHTIYRAGKELGIHNRTVHRWVLKRETMGPAWPTDQDIADWEADDAANAEKRAAKAAWGRQYRKRVYLNRGPLQVPILGTMRRIRALSALGWTFEEIGVEMGVTAARVGHLAAGMWDTVFPQTALEVDRVYRKLCMTVPTDPEPTRRGEVRVHARSRKWARNKGWAPPLAFDDIDDPNEKPTLGSKRDNRRKRTDVDSSVVDRFLAGENIGHTTKAEKCAIAEAWTRSGRSTHALAARTGWKVERYVRVTEMREAS